jgi:hypothetical protein
MEVETPKENKLMFGNVIGTYSLILARQLL